MTPRIPFSSNRKIQIKLITLLACLLALAILLSTVGRASAAANAVNGPDPLYQRGPAPGQMAPEENAALGELAATADGQAVTLTPAFDGDITFYTATVDAASVSVSASAAATGAGIDRTSAGDVTLELHPPGSPVTTGADLAEGTITTVSLRVRAADGVTTKTYHLFLSRPADPSVPDVTIEAATAEYFAGMGALLFTLTREGPTTDSLNVTVNFTQEQPWLSDTSHTVTFAAGDDEAPFLIPAGDFSSGVTESGDLIATASPVAGYDVSGAIAQVRVIYLEGPAVTVSLEHPMYTVAEDAGTLDVVLVARAHSSLTSVDAFSVAVTSEARTAVSDPEAPDFQPVSELPRFTPSDFQMENGALVGRKTLSVTILEDDLIEGDEYFHLHPGPPPGLTSEVAILDPEGNLCGVTCPSPYVVTIKDNDPAVTVGFAQNAYTVAEGNTRDITVTLSDDPQRTVVIPITVEDQDGASNADYSIMPQSVTFNAGETSRTISFAATHDNIDDDRERVALCFCATLPPGVTEGPIKETIVTITQRVLNSGAGRPGISVPRCESNGTFLFWHAGNEFEDDPAPYGWRVERRHRSDGAWVTTRFDFLGAESDALQTYSEAFWDWTDATRLLGVDYTYRVHALDENGQLMDGRTWSRRAAGLCPQRDLSAFREQPGISKLACKSNGISIFWHVGIDFGDQPPPYGWRVERRHLSDGEWITTRFDFLGAASDALQTYSDEYWDWTDATRRPGVDYTYRFHALDGDGELMEGRTWSRRAMALCR